MPNWCKGTLRVRGTKEDLTKFVLEGLNPVTYLGQELEPLKMDGLGRIDCERCWIKGTYRGFVVDSHVYFDDLEDEEETTIGLKQNSHGVLVRKNYYNLVKNTELT